MNYENYPYDIFNPMYLKNTYVQQLENWRNVEQQKIFVIWLKLFPIIAKLLER